MEIGIWLSANSYTQMMLVLYSKVCASLGDMLNKERVIACMAYVRCQCQHSIHFKRGIITATLVDLALKREIIYSPKEVLVDSDIIIASVTGLVDLSLKFTCDFIYFWFHITLSGVFLFLNPPLSFYLQKSNCSNTFNPSFSG
jgi:hypothetical protein